MEEKTTVTGLRRAGDMAESALYNDGNICVADLGAPRTPGVDGNV